MNAKQTKLIEQAAMVETDGEGWRKRMQEWLLEQDLVYFDNRGRGIMRVLVKNQSTPDYFAWVNEHDAAILLANRTP